MNESTRRQILADLGIEVWLPRAALARQRHSDRGSARERPAPGASPTGSQATVPARAAAPRTAAVAAESLAVLSLAVPGVLLAVAGTPSRRGLRLARDILAAASGRWTTAPRRRQFRWPPALPAPGADAVAAVERALSAFIDKDVADHGVSLLLCTAQVDARLTGTWLDCRRQVIAPLESLGRDPAAKRALWRWLCEARA